MYDLVLIHQDNPYDWSILTAFMLTGRFGNRHHKTVSILLYFTTNECRHQNSHIRQFPSILQRISRDDCVLMPTRNRWQSLSFNSIPSKSTNNILFPVPPKIFSTLHHYTSLGYRVIALSHRTLPPIPYVKLMKTPREEVETNLIFCGLIMFENQLKPQTTPVIAELSQANIKCVMVTGDNIHTALSVARECGMIDGRVVEVREEKKEITFIDIGVRTFNNYDITCLWLLSK